MSRGPGRRQQQLLDALAAAPADGGVWVTDQSETASEQVSARRAAYRLEELGRVKLVVLDGRLVAVRPDAPFKRYVVVGRDGKNYRSTHGAPVD